MAGREGLGDRVQRDRRHVLPAGLQALGRLVARQVRQVEDLRGDEPGDAARRHVVQPGGDQRQRPVAREAEREPRVAEDLERLRRAAPR